MPYRSVAKTSDVKRAIDEVCAAVKGGKILLLGNHWGDDMIITSHSLRDTRSVTALTYMEIATLSRDDLEAALVDFPISERHLRVCALKIAFHRAGIVIATLLHSPGERKKRMSGNCNVLRIDTTPGEHAYNSRDRKQARPIPSGE